MPAQRRGNVDIAKIFAALVITIFALSLGVVAFAIDSVSALLWQLQAWISED